MQRDYQKALDKLNAAVITIETVVHTAESRSYEDRQMLHCLEAALDAIHRAIAAMEYWNREAVTGVLAVLSNGRFCIGPQELTCGRVVEAYSTEYNEWILGRIEYRDNDYFLDAEGEPVPLHAGMKARVRL